MRLAYAEMMKREYWRCNATGPSQGAKTTTFFAIPIPWMVFELGETVICGLPDMGMASSKWNNDLKPIIENTKYRELLPAKGDGARGGKDVDEIYFRNGARLKFMGAGGGDKQRSHYTAPNLVITETDGFDSHGADAASKEADKISQLEARTNAFQRTGRRIWMECTVTTERGRTWVNHLNGTNSRIICPCPHCKSWVSPEREHLRGWQAQPTILDAEDNAWWACPHCNEEITERQRTGMNTAATLIHRGQELTEDGRIVGTIARTNMFSIRWSAFNNLLATASSVAADEWNASKAADRENAEKKQKQFVWCLPYEPPDIRVMPLSQEAIARRLCGLPRGVVPADAPHLVAHLDLGKHQAWWMVCAGRPGFGMHIVDHGCITVDSERLGVEPALLDAMAQYHLRMKQGFVKVGVEQPIIPTHCWIDGGWQGGRDQKGEAYVVYQFCKDTTATDTYERWRPVFGRGTSSDTKGSYHTPAPGPQVHVSDNYHFHFTQTSIGQMWLVEANADYWKGFTHARMSAPMPVPGAQKPDYRGCLTLFDATPEQHAELTLHLTAEEQREEFVEGKGMRRWWHPKHRLNHKGDNLYNCAVMLHFDDCRLFEEVKPEPAPTHGQDARATQTNAQDVPAFVASQRKD